MKFSIITVNLNNYKGIQRTYNSIVCQTCKNFEWIVIDGGSTDGSKEFIEEKGKDVSFWCSEKDTGIYNAMNKGVQHANGDYCLFLNSGDELCDSDIIKKIQEIPFQSDIVSFDMYVDSVTPKAYRKSPDVVNAVWLLDHSLYHPVSWIKRELLINMPYDESYRMISDWVFFYEALVVHECSYQHEPMPMSVFYRDGISCNPGFIERAQIEGSKYIQTRFPLKYIEDRKTIAPFYDEALQMSEMSPFFRKIAIGFIRMIVMMDSIMFRR